MRTLSINKYMLMNVANSIGIYTFKELKNNKSFRNLDILKSFCSLKKKLDELSNDPSEDEYVKVSIDDNVETYLSTLISKYIFDEISECEEPDFEWVCEMMNILDQLSDDSASESDIGFKKSIVTDDQMDPAAEIKNRDVINELNSDISEVDLNNNEEINTIKSSSESENTTATSDNEWSLEETEDIELF